VRIIGRIAVIAALTAPVVAAQQVRGTISDSTTRQPVSGAIVALLDSAGTSVARTIANEAGEYSLPLRDNGRRLRVQRLGFRPNTVALPADRSAQMRVDIAILPIATFLQAVAVSASACGSRPDRGSAIALFEQARTGLLATVVAREANPARMVMYGFERTMDGTSDRIVRQQVRVDSAARAKVTFSAGISGAEMVEQGFVRETEGGRVFLAPDADVLLGDQFAAGYCFGRAKAQDNRPNQLGISFSAARSKRDRVDIEGALWIDTLKRALVDMDFHYVGLTRREEMLRPGGRIEFREMPNAAVLVDRWALRLIGSTTDSVVMARPQNKPVEYQVITSNYVSETGGELAHARWRDGRTWNASMGTLRIKAMHGDKPATGFHVALDETPYRGIVDAEGNVEFSNVVPGPYKMITVDPALTEVGLVVPTTFEFTAARDSLHRAEVFVMDAKDYIYQRCVADKINDTRDSTRLLVRFMTHTGEPVDGVAWKVSKRPAGSETGTSAGMMAGTNGHTPMVAPNKSGPGVSLGAYKVLRDGGQTGSDGLFQMCVGNLYRGTQLLIQASRPGYEELSVDVRLTGPLQVLRLNMIPRQ
jgi:hypothetical protein